MTKKTSTGKLGKKTKGKMTHLPQTGSSMASMAAESQVHSKHEKHAQTHDKETVIKVRVGRGVGKLHTVNLTSNKTMSGALKAAELNVEDGEEVRLNGKRVTNMQTAVKNNDTIMLVEPIQGG